MGNTNIRRKSPIKWGTKLYFVYLHPIGGCLRRVIQFMLVHEDLSPGKFYVNPKFSAKP